MSAVIRALVKIFPTWWWASAAVTVLAAALFVGVWPIPEVRALATPLLEERWFDASQFAADFFQQLGRDGRQLYLVQQLLDLPFIVLYGAALAAGIGFAVRRLRPSWHRWLVGFALLAPLSDLTEDALLLTLLASFPDMPMAVVSLIGPVVGAKLSLVTGTVLLFFGLAAAAVWIQASSGGRWGKGQGLSSS